MTRALVLSGGGPIGIGWHSGMIAALSNAGLDMAGADLFVGTSAGAVVGSRIALGRDPLEEIKRLTDVEPDSGYSQALGDNMQRLLAIMASSAEMSPDERLKALCALALEAETAPEESFLAGFDALGGDGWPPRFVCTAIDALDGTFTTWDADSQVDPVRAIASSCSVPGFFPPITINGRRYIDGGMRSLTNADLAAGNERVLILTLFEPPADSPDPRAQRIRGILDAEMKAIADKGGRAQILAPDADAQVAIGPNLMDPSRVTQATDAGYAQGTRAAGGVADFWNGS